MSALIVNLFGGPGSGKSTLAAGVFHHLKKKGENCEFVHEFAKELAWENRTEALQNQVYILGEQYQRLLRCSKHVDTIVTDTSILLGVIYARKYGAFEKVPQFESFERLVLDLFNSMNNLNFYVERRFPYQKVGRYQDEDDAIDVDKRVRSALVGYKIPYGIVNGDDPGVYQVLMEITAELQERKANDRSCA